MLLRLYIQNYAIIHRLDIAFRPGLTTMTGETGAGKSILLGALGLVLGKRADSSVLHSQDEKCIVEADFRAEGFELEEFFAEHDLDFTDVLTLRREVTADGRSRAFVNDTPVTLPVLKSLAEQLIDVHSQQGALSLNEAGFRARFVDACADGGEAFRAYASAYSRFIALRRDLAIKEEAHAQAKAEEDYLRFQLDELETLHIRSGELGEGEARLSMLENAEEIGSTLAQVAEAMSTGEGALLDRLAEVRQHLHRIGRKFAQGGPWAERVDSALIDLRDLCAEIDRTASTVEGSPEEAGRLRERIDSIHRVMLKHRCQSDTELIALRNELEVRLGNIAQADEETEALRSALTRAEQGLTEAGKALTAVRSGVAIPVAERLSSELRQLGMPDATVGIGFEASGISPLGAETIEVLFSANKGQQMHDVAKAASGGELSRLMLAVKAEMARRAQLPTIIFDEIDTGVSGAVADRMGEKIRELAGHMQVICITHLPQIAAKGNQHLFVHKEEERGRTVTRIRALSGEERVTEIAKMMSGSSPSEAAKAHAAHLLKD